MYQTRVSAERVDVVRGLGHEGMYVVDLTLTFGRRPTLDPHAVAGVAIVEAAADQEEQLLAIAASAFRYSRFHLDPLIPAAVANRIKQDWVESYLRGRRGEKLLVALIGGTVAGFLGILADQEDSRALLTIDLVAVAPECRSQGVATALTHAFLVEAEDHCDEVRVGTQAANIGATRLYERLGFSIVNTEYAMHGHIDT